MIKTAKQLSVGIGTVGTISLEGLDVPVEVVDMRVRWGIVDACIRVTGRTQTKWVESHRVQVAGYKEVGGF